MTISTLLIIILILILIGAVPAWPHSRSWGYGPSGIVGVIVVALLILLSLGRILPFKRLSAGLGSRPVHFLRWSGGEARRLHGDADILHGFLHRLVERGMRDFADDLFQSLRD